MAGHSEEMVCYERETDIHDIYPYLQIMGYPAMPPF